MANLKDDPEAARTLDRKINGRISSTKIQYDAMLEPVPILDKDIDM